jgi:hypothetical protein
VVEEVEEGSRGSPYSLIGWRCTRGKESKSTLMAAAAHPIWGRERESSRRKGEEDAKGRWHVRDLGGASRGGGEARGALVGPIYRPAMSVRGGEIFLDRRDISSPMHVLGAGTRSDELDTATYSRSPARSSSSGASSMVPEGFRRSRLSGRVAC